MLEEKSKRCTGSEHGTKIDFNLMSINCIASDVYSAVGSVIGNVGTRLIKTSPVLLNSFSFEFWPSVGATGEKKRHKCGQKCIKKSL